MTDTFWHWRGYTIWFFDGYYDVHRKGDPQPLVEGLPTADDARNFIRRDNADDKFAEAPFGGGRPMWKN